MNRKYKLIEKRKSFYNGLITIQRIQALRDFENVKAGDLGGWVECEDNLSHE